MRFLSIIFLVLSFPFLAFTQHHEIKIDLMDMNFKHSNFNLGYEYLFLDKLGIHAQVGHSTKTLSKYNNSILGNDNCKRETESLHIVQIIETISRQQTFFVVEGKYYLHQTPRFDLFSIGLFFRSDFFLDRISDSDTNLIILNSPLQITPRNSNHDPYLPIAKSRFNVGITIAGKIFLLEKKLFLEPELGWQVDLLQLGGSGILGNLNLGYRLK